jgi:integrase
MGRKPRTGVRAISASSIEISFTYQGKRCREKIKLQPTPVNLKRAERHRAAILDAIDKGTFDYATTFPQSKSAPQFSDQPGATITVERFLSNWWPGESKELKASTRTVDKRIIFNQIIPQFGQLSLTDLKWHQIRDWAKSQGWSRKTQNNKLSVLRRALNEAVEQELIHHHPMANKVIRRRKSRSESASNSKTRIDPFSHEERTALITTARGQLKNLVQFGFWTGLRLSEIFALNWGNVDWINKRIYVEGALTQAAEAIEETKTEAGERVVNLLPPAHAALKAQKEHTFLAGKEVFQNPHTRERWTGDQALRKRQWDTLCRRSGVRYRPPGQMRHTFASMTLMAGESPQWVAAQMGHTDWTFTARVYYRWIPRDAGDAGAKVIKKWGRQLNVSTN